MIRTFVAALLASISAGAVALPSAPTTAPVPAVVAPTTLLWVCNQNDASVSIVDAATGKVLRTVDLQKLGFSANAKPHHIVVEPDGSFWYVTLIGENKIVK